MLFSFGRENLALTVFVPYDCRNKCPFCSSKETYRTHRPSMDNVKYQLKRVLTEFDYPIKDVVFTGGEPMADVKGLKELIDLVPSQYNIYINTTFTNRNIDEFVGFVNECSKIKGINISRHSETYEQECALLCDIATDDKIAMIQKPVRINCVVKNQDISKVIERWNGTGVHLYFRKDFNIEQDFTELHNPYDELTMKLIADGFAFKSHTKCNVCDTTIFEKDGQIVAYHKGQKKSSIQVGEYLEINDLIIDQTGAFTFDWGKNDLRIISELEKKHKTSLQSAIEKMRNALQIEPTYTVCHSHYSCGGYNRGCGGSGC